MIMVISRVVICGVETNELINIIISCISNFLNCKFIWFQNCYYLE